MLFGLTAKRNDLQKKKQEELHFMNVWLTVQMQAVELHLTQWYLAFILVAGRL